VGFRAEPPWMGGVREEGKRNGEGGKAGRGKLRPPPTVVFKSRRLAVIINGVGLWC